MELVTQLWLPILLSAVFVFIASSILHMVIKFWHGPDYHGFSNEDEVAAAIRKGNPAPGVYVIPHCTPESMKDPAMQEKFKQGPIAKIFLRQGGAINLGSFLGQWFVFCLMVSLFCAFLSAHVLPNGAPFAHVFHLIGLAALLAYAFGAIPNAIWWGFPWGSTIKHFIDGIIYAVITGATFAWLWPVA
ncbi:MAG: hypothetical protein ABI451_11795 [Dokdonella sp.]